MNHTENPQNNPQASSSLEPAPESSPQKDQPGWLEGISRYHWLVFVGCWLGGIFDGMDSTLMSVAMPTAIGELTGSTDKSVIGPIASYVTSIFLLGWMAGGILFGVIGDKLGRVRSMVFSILLYALFTGLAGFAQNWEQLAVCRFLTGLGIGGELVSISTFLTEVWPARSRAIAIGVLITSYQAGVFIAGSINTLFQDWRTTFWIGALPALLVIFLRTSLKESDRWLEAKERSLQAEKPASHWQALFQPAHAQSLLVGGLAFGGLLVGYWASLAWIPLWVQDLLQTSGTGAERGIVTMYQGVAAVVGCSMAGLFCDWLGRRSTIILSSLGCLLASGLLFLTNTSFSSAIYWQTALLGYFIGLIQAAMYIYLPELFPTLIRASATGFCLNVGRLTTAIAVFYVGDLIQLISKQQLGAHWFGNASLSDYGVAAFLFALAYLASVGAALFGAETKGKPLLE
ncbi:MFS transporter [Vampirovibrio chlorellavorus]|uniref:MFS transporter n=1 Tax=Vampirovibrio chlorellavorus TaxID=758823 RepID=UPI0026F0C600|nr:MFS transporter [Vampirovibrio chlorellavorus]